MSKRKFKVLVTHCEVPKEALEMLEDDCEIIKCRMLPCCQEEILANVSNGVDGIFCTSHVKVDSELLDKAGKRLKVVSCMSAGLDNVNIEELKRRCILLGCCPEALYDAVAELTIGLMISSARKFNEGRQMIEMNNWESFRLAWMLGKEIRNSVIGFIGFGGIAKAVATKLQSFNVCKVIYTNKSNKARNTPFKSELKSFNDVLRESDFIIVTCPLTPETKNLISEDAFSKMKTNAIFINVSRGDIVDQTALMAALKCGKLFAAGIDVMTPEPLPPNHALLSTPNLVITPHLGSATTKTRTNMAKITAQNILNGLKGKSLISSGYEL